MQHALATIVSPRNEETQRAVAAFLSRYGAVTRASYASDLRAWFAWCADHYIEPLAVARAHVELWARDMEERQGLATSTVARRLSTIIGFYRFAVIDGLLDRSPADFVRRPHRDSESTTLGLDRMELGAFIAQAGAAGPMDHALACLLGLLGMRVSEACGVDIENLGTERGHRTVFIIGKGNKPALIPLPPRVARAVDAARGDRLEGPLLLTRSGRRLDRHAATRTVRRVAKRAGITKRISPHSLRHSFITAALDAGVPLRDVQIAARHADPRTTTRYDRARNNLDRHASYIVTAFVAGAA
jgi:site-specific recombinase XerD